MASFIDSVADAIRDTINQPSTYEKAKRYTRRRVNEAQNYVTGNQGALDKAQNFLDDKFGSVEEYMQRTRTQSEPDYLRGFVAGVIGGLVGVGVKMIVDKAIPATAPEPEHDPRIQVVEGAEEVINADLNRNQEEVAQKALDVGFGVIVGGIYGVVAEALPGMQTPAGVPFGAGLWTATHKLAMPLLGLAPGPLKEDASNQLGQLASHVAYGATVEVVRRGVRHLMDEEDVL